MYSPWTDGRVGSVSSRSGGKKATTGYATILGDDPLHLEIIDAGIYPGDPTPYEGRYPCGSLVYNGVWYYGTYCLLDSDHDPSKGFELGHPGAVCGISLLRWITERRGTTRRTRRPIPYLASLPRRAGK